MVKIKNILLTVLSFPFLLFAFLRRLFYRFDILKSNKFSVPIISVGNLSFGGTGKTPFCLWLARYFESKSYKVAICMRGYGSKITNRPQLIFPDEKKWLDSELLGDEAHIYLHNLKYSPLFIGKNRSLNLWMNLRNAESNVVILDDGFQHLKIKRNFNILLIDALMPVENYFVIPKGKCREPISSIVDADHIIITRTNMVEPEKMESIKNLIHKNSEAEIQISEIDFIPVSVRNLKGTKKNSLEEFAKNNIYLMCGLGRPEGFIKTAKGLFPKIIGEKIYPDHYKYRKKDIDAICEKAEKENFCLLLTEKDIVKMKKLTDSKNIFYLEIDVEFKTSKEMFLSNLKSHVSL